MAILPNVKLFWSRVQTAGEDDCWPWKLATNDDGYGIVAVKKQNGAATTMRAHVVAFLLSGRSVPAGCKVCHSCDNPPCCNPKHLWAGTHKQNMQDMVLKGRRVGKNQGEVHGLAKLTETIVREARRLHATGLYTYEFLAARYKVSKVTVARAVRRETWSHL